MLLYPKLYEDNASKVLPVTDFFTDVAAGTLPGFCLVEPNTEPNRRRTRKTSRRESNSRLRSSTP